MIDFEQLGQVKLVSPPAWVGVMQNLVFFEHHEHCTDLASGCAGLTKLNENNFE